MEVDFSDPVARRAYLEELRRERLVEEEAQEAREQRRWVQETEPELPRLPIRNRPLYGLRAVPLMTPRSAR
jgi:hypothetical protein